MLLLADRDRLALLPDLVAVYRERLLDHQQIVRAEVTTAVPLPAGPRRAAGEAAGRGDRTARDDDRAASIPALIGGIVTRIGSTVYDGSIATHLETMKQQLLQKT